MKTRQTFNINLEKIGDEAKAARVLRAWQPSAILAMNAYNPADGATNIGVRFQRLLAEWGGYMIYRQYSGAEGALWQKYPNEDAYLDEMARYMGAPNVILNVGNEPSGDSNAPGGKQGDIERGAAWYARLIPKAVARGWMITVPAMPVAAFETNQIVWWKPMLQALVDHRHLKRPDGRSVVGLNIHEYGHGDPTVHAAGRDPRLLLKKVKDRPAPPTWAEVMANPDVNYLLFRGERFYAAMAALAGVSVDELGISIDTTEAIFDRMQNIEKDFPDVCAFVDSFNGGKKAFGIPTLTGYLEWAYEKPIGEALCDICAWWEMAPARYWCLCHYSWTEHDDHPHFWRTNFAVQNQDQWFELWPARAAQIRSNPPVTISPVSKPSSATEWYTGALQTSDFVNIRIAPTTSAAQVRVGNDKQPRQGATLTVYKGGEVTANGFPWSWVRWHETNVEGWMARVNTAWEQQVKLPAAPPLPSWWPTDSLSHLDVPFVTQRLGGQKPEDYNNCGEACVTMVINYYRAKLGLSGQIDIIDVMNYIDNAGGYALLYDKDRRDLYDAALHFGDSFDLTATVKSGLTMQDLVVELMAGRPVIALVTRGKLPGAQAYYKFEGSHFVVVVGYDAAGLTVHDPLSLSAGPGDSLFVTPADFQAAWESTPGNSARFQALLTQVPELPDDEEPPEDPGDGAEVTALRVQVAELQAKVATLTTERDSALAARDAAQGALADLKRSILAVVEAAS